MKKKSIKQNASNDLVAKKDLRKSLAQTEERLYNRIDRVLKYIDFKINPFEEMRRDFYDFKNKLLDRLDWLIGKYQKFENEYTIQAEQNRRIIDRVENHEERINIIEKLFKHN